MLKKVGLISLILALGRVMAISANFAAVSNEQWGVIMNLSGRQRMLSQKMTKEALLATSGINAEENRKNLKETMNTFERVLKGLRDGDASLNLPACENEEITAKLDKINLFI